MAYFKYCIHIMYVLSNIKIFITFSKGNNRFLDLNVQDIK